MGLSHGDRVFLAPAANGSGGGSNRWFDNEHAFASANRGTCA